MSVPMFDLCVNGPQTVRMKTCNGFAVQSYLCPFSASGSEFMRKKESILRSSKEGIGARVKAVIFWSG